MMTQETFREAVISAIEGIDGERRVDGYATEFLNGATDLSEWEREVIADAAIATMFERLRTPSEEMLKAGEHAWMNRDLNDPASHPIRDCFRAMLTAFQQENSECRE
jgi:hypothetical protein